ncbi:hypothetical protein R1flu_011136 [Riccia fluitans]|uniref:Uncharacterized protein n=1 Tax=Riccia fluitans TaxID=41844 RepID=A0ABD1Z9G0_9MARC
MSRIRQRISKQSYVPPEERPSQRQRRATSPNYELPHDEAMETIDRLVQDEVFLHLKFDCLKTEEILFIDGILFARGVAGPQGQLPINVSREGLKEYLLFPGSKDSSYVVSASVIEVEFLHRTGHKSLKNAWTTIARWFDYRNAQPRNEGWFIDELVFFSSQGCEDGKLLDMCAKLVICQALKWIGRLLLSYTSIILVLLALAQVDPQSPNLKPDWCKLVRERDQLKDDLLKAQDVLVDAAQQEEALRAEHERLQEEYS